MNALEKMYQESVQKVYQKTKEMYGHELFELVDTGIWKEAMEEYAQQQAVGFAEWLWYNGWTKVAIDKYRKDNFMTGEFELKTTEELYEIFKTESK